MIQVPKFQGKTFDIFTNSRYRKGGQSKFNEGQKSLGLGGDFLDIFPPHNQILPVFLHHFLCLKGFYSRGPTPPPCSPCLITYLFLYFSQNSRIGIIILGSIHVANVVLVVQVELYYELFFLGALSPLFYHILQELTNEKSSGINFFVHKNFQNFRFFQVTLLYFYQNLVPYFNG